MGFKYMAAGYRIISYFRQTKEEKFLIFLQIKATFPGNIRYCKEFMKSDKKLISLVLLPFFKGANQIPWYAPGGISIPNVMQMNHRKGIDYP